MCNLLPLNQYLACAALLVGAYNPPYVGRRRLMRLWWVRSCGFFGGEPHCDHVLRDLPTGSHASVKYPERQGRALPASFIQANKSPLDGAVFALV